MHTHFVTTVKGIDRNTYPMKLFEKAKRFGVWNPSDIDLSQDKLDWETLNGDEQDVLLRLISLFVAGEEAVTLDLLPLIMAIAQEGRVEEEMFLTTFLWEEAKHVDFFDRVLTNFLGVIPDLSHYHGDSYRQLFYEALPTAMNRLREDQSPEAMIRASMTYNMVVEGMLAETGYYTFFEMLEERDIMPGLRQGINLLKQDESRHIAFGIYLISRLIRENPSLWTVVEEVMGSLMMPALGIVSEPYALYDPMPFGMDMNRSIQYAQGQFNKRIMVLQRAKAGEILEAAEMA